MFMYFETAACYYFIYSVSLESKASLVQLSSCDSLIGGDLFAESWIM